MSKLIFFPKSVTLPASTERVKPSVTQKYEDWLYDKDTRCDSYLAGGGGGLANPAANLGTPQDLSTYDVRNSPAYINQTYFSTFYRTSPIAKRILDLFTNDLFGKGLKFKSLTSAQEKRLTILWADNGYNNLLRKCIRQMLLHGGCALYLKTQLDGNQSKPLEPYEVKHHFEKFVFVDKSLMFPSGFDSGDAFLNLEEPQAWTIVQPTADTHVLNIHKSRFIRFVPIELPFFAKLTDLWWGDSIFTQNKSDIDSIERAFHSASNLICQSTVRFYKTDIRQYAKDNKRLDTLKGDSFGQSLRQQMLSQNYSAHVMDKDDDVVSLEVKNLKDQSDLLKSLLGYSALPFGMPLTRFMGISSAGFSSGDSELLQWYEEIDGKREAILRQPFRRFLDTISEIHNFPRIEFDFTPLNEPNDVQLADIEVQHAQVAKMYFDMGIPMETIVPELQRAGSFKGLTLEQANALGKKIDRQNARSQQETLEQKEMKTARHSPELPTNKLSGAKPDSVSRVKPRE